MLQLKELPSIFLKPVVCWLPHAEDNLCFFMLFAKKLAEFTTTKGVTTIISGGDFVAAVEKVGLADKMSHIFLPGQMPIHLLKKETLHNICRIDYELDKWVSFSLEHHQQSG